MEYTEFSEKVAIFSDLHLGKFRDSQKWHRVSLDWANWIAIQLKLQNIKDIIFMGDFFDSRSEISVTTLQVGAQILEILKDFNIIMIVGNHDSWYKEKTDINSLSIFKGYSNIRVIEKAEILTIQQKECLFLPWGCSESDIKPVDYIFGHLEIESFRLNNYKLCDKGLKTRDLTNNAKLTFSGHFHLRDERIYENSKIIYVGNPFQMDFGDINSPKGYYILDFKTDEFEFFENKISPVHRKITVSELVKYEDLNSKGPQQFFGGNIVQLIIDKPLSSDNIDIFVRKISLLNPFSLTLDYVINTNPNVKIDGDLTGVDISKVIEEFINCLDNIPKEAVNNYCQELYKRCK